ncbi:unnamed protein product, partial [Discosporangium mesarthrocarpum]
MSLDDLVKRNMTSRRTVGGARSGGVRGSRGDRGSNNVKSVEQARPKLTMASKSVGTFRSAISSATAPHNPRTGGIGPVRRAGVARVARRTTAPYDMGVSRTSESILDRLGERVTPVAIRVSNLNYDVMEEDIRELFQHVGKIEQCNVKFDKSGRSEGEATIVFGSRELAEQAVSQFNNRTLDQTPMVVELLESYGRPRSGSDIKGGQFHRGSGRRDGPSAGIFANESEGNGFISRGNLGANSFPMRPYTNGNSHGATGGDSGGPVGRPNIRSGIFGTALDSQVHDDSGNFSEDIGGFNNSSAGGYGGGFVTASRAQGEKGTGRGVGQGRPGGGGRGGGVRGGSVQFSVTLNGAMPGTRSIAGGGTGGDRAGGGATWGNNRSVAGG